MSMRKAINDKCETGSATRWQAERGASRPKTALIRPARYTPTGRCRQAEEKQQIGPQPEGLRRYREGLQAAK